MTPRVVFATCIIGFKPILRDIIVQIAKSRGANLKKQGRSIVMKIDELVVALNKGRMRAVQGDFVLIRDMKHHSLHGTVHRSFR